MKEEISAGKVETIKSVTDDINIEVKMFKYLDGKYVGKIGVRSRDLDSENNIGLTICKNMEQAEIYFQKYLKG